MAILKAFEENLLDLVTGVSYIGKPKNHTIMFLTKKIEEKLRFLNSVEGCLVFIENTIVVPESLSNRNTFIMCENPAQEYTIVVSRLAKILEDKLRTKKYVLTSGGYYIGEDVVIGKNTFIEPMAFIDHGVIIGNNVLIKTGAKIRYNTIIGNNCSISENAVIGEPGFNYTKSGEPGDEKLMLIPSFGHVVIGDYVDIGANTKIFKGGGTDTVIENNVKIDAGVTVGHDAYIHKNVEIAGESVVGGYSVIGEGTFMAGAAHVKPRLSIGKNCYLGMRSVVYHNLKDGVTVTGNPAVTVEQLAKRRVFEMKLKSFMRKQ